MQKRGKQEAYVEGTDYAEFRFTSGSIFDVIGGHPRGMRRNFGMLKCLNTPLPVITGVCL